MSEEPKIKGKLYSNVYLGVEGAPADDSPNFRERLYAYVAYKLENMNYSLGEALHRELGQRFPLLSSTKASLHKFFLSAAIEFVLDAVTIIYDEIREVYREKTAGSYSARDYTSSGRREMTRWTDFVNRVLREENIGYFVDDLGGVHPLVDEEFQRSKQATIAGLSDPNFEHVLNLYESTFEQLDQRPPATREAVANIYSSVEALYKTLTNAPPKSNLSAAAARQKLVPIIQQKYGSDPIACATATELLESFLKWTQAAHNYRHGQQKAPVNPPFEIAVGLISVASSFIRWLLSIYE